MERRDYEDEQHGHRDARDREDDGRVDHRALHLADDEVVFLEKLRQAQENRVENTTRFAGGHHVHVEIAERLGVLPQRVGEGVTAFDVVDNLARDIGQDLVLGLLLQNVEGLHQWEAGIDHRGELPREDDDVACLDPCLEQVEHAAALTLGLPHLHHDHTVLPQVRDDIVASCQVDLILDEIALEIACSVFKIRHNYLRTATLGGPACAAACAGVGISLSSAGASPMERRKSFGLDVTRRHSSFVTSRPM